MPMYNLIEYPNNCSKTSGSLWQYYRDNPIAISAESESFESNLKTPEVLLLMVMGRMLK